MEMEQCFMPFGSNRLVHDYIEGKPLPFFHYSYHNRADYVERLRELEHQSFPRKELENHIRTFMEPYGLTEEIERSLEKLRQENSVVVIGGQQVGLLTGPLYSIYKMISILCLSRQLEDELHVPVVPVFWMAGEDHDIYEVNHVFVPRKRGLEKRIFRSATSDKKMMSKVEFDAEFLRDFCFSCMAAFGETSFTGDCLKLIDEALKNTHTYTEFFTALVHSFFKQSGLLLVDSAHPGLRKMEASYFKLQLQRAQDISEKLRIQQEEMLTRGYKTLIDSPSNSLHLFLERNGERILLQHHNGKIEAKGQGFTLPELLEIADRNPESFSNNVVTRPLMQEFLFPTIAFIAGPGEINYWAELKQVFELFGKKMPPIVPRINITILERAVERDLKELDIKIEKAIQFGVQKEREERIRMLKDHDLEAHFQEAVQRIEAEYEDLAKRALMIDQGLSEITKKNRELVKRQLVYLEKKAQQSVLRKHDEILAKYDRIDCSLHPNGTYQERVWNVFYFLNHYGLDFIDSLMEMSFRLDGSHYIIKL